MERFQSQETNKVNDREQSQVKIVKRKAALENLRGDVDINLAWEAIRENINLSAKENLGYYELKQHEIWFNKGCLKLLDLR
jgi:hypothetical protein